MKKRIITISREFGSGGRFMLIMIKISLMRLQRSLVYLRNMSGKVQNYLRRKDYLHMHLPDVISQENP